MSVLSAWNGAGDMGTASGSRSAYHHGDLRNALVAAAVELASDGGPERVVLREVARRVGVSPTAAYRHFDGQGGLMYAVKVRGQEALAESMEDAAARIPEARDPGVAAERRFTALGRGYVRFALRRPGLFRSAFCRIPDAEGAEGEPRDWTEVPPADGEPRYRALGLLTAVLDELVAHGRMPAHRRPAAEVTAWSTVHGLSVLLMEGPLSRLPDEQGDAVLEHALSTVLAGLAAP
jgi:AcrR family transcriptional regulator